MNYLKISDVVESVSITHKFDLNTLYSINTSDVLEGEVLCSHKTQINDLKGQFKKTIQKNDILFSEIRPANKRYARVTFEDTEKYVVSTKLMVLRKYNNNVDLDYFYYFLTNPSFLKLLQSRAENRICSFPQITFELLSEYSIPIPDIHTQRNIGSFLYLIDKKYKSNNQIITELESLAKTIYNYWFLQFDFPDENGKPYKSSGGKMVRNEELKREIPEGWEVRKLPTVADTQYGIPLSTELFSDDGAPVIRIRDIVGNSISAFTSENVSSNYLTKEGDLLVGMDGNFQMNYWFRDNEIVNQRIVRIRETTLPIMIIRYQIEPHIVAKVDNVARSTVGHLGDDDIKNLKIIVPSQNLDYAIFATIMREINILKKETEQLTTLRDFLLPMLMNGQVMISD